MIAPLPGHCLLQAARDVGTEVPEVRPTRVEKRSVGMMPTASVLRRHCPSPTPIALGALLPSVRAVDDPTAAALRDAVIALVTAGVDAGAAHSLGTDVHDRLLAHAAAYGWTLPSWARRGGSKPEPWHWECVG